MRLAMFNRDSPFSQWIVERLVEAELLDAALHPDEAAARVTEREAACATLTLHVWLGATVGPLQLERVAGLLGVSVADIEAAQAG
jgi:hypothetical protein